MKSKQSFRNSHSFRLTGISHNQRTPTRRGLEGNTVTFVGLRRRRGSVRGDPIPAGPAWGNSSTLIVVWSHTCLSGRRFGAGPVGPRKTEPALPPGGRVQAHPPAADRRVPGPRKGRCSRPVPSGHGPSPRSRSRSRSRSSGGQCAGAARGAHKRQGRVGPGVEGGVLSESPNREGVNRALRRKAGKGDCSRGAREHKNCSLKGSEVARDAAGEAERHGPEQRTESSEATLGGPGKISPELNSIIQTLV